MKLNYYIKKSGLPQKELAQKLGVKQSTISMWKNGSRTPRSDKLPLLATVLHCTVDDLFDAIPASSEKSA